jgi:hypothetical protein
MSAEMFDILMVAALGTSAGAGTGLIIGCMTHHQKKDWKTMSTRERNINYALVLFFCVLFCGALGYYSLIKL